MTLVFLERNGLRFDAPESDVVTAILALAAGEMSERSLAEWLRAHVRERRAPGGG